MNITRSFKEGLVYRIIVSPAQRHMNHDYDAEVLEVRTNRTVALYQISNYADGYRAYKRGKYIGDAVTFSTALDVIQEDFRRTHGR